MSEELPVALMFALIIFGLLFFTVFAVGLMLVKRDTIRQRGKWGINLKPTVCIECGTPMPTVRKPASWRQAMWGGWTCAECGFELDKWGRPTEKQNNLAKWAVFRAVKKTEECEYQTHNRDENIRKGNDQTKRGDLT